MKTLSIALIGLAITAHWIAKGEEFTIAEFSAYYNQTNGAWSNTNIVVVPASHVIELNTFIPISFPAGIFVEQVGGSTNAPIVWGTGEIPKTSPRFVGPIQLRMFGQGILTYRLEPKETPPLPSTSVVIPSDATGPVEIKLESSSDLVNWQDALPGIYGATTTNRFFRVRAVKQ